MSTIRAHQPRLVERHLRAIDAVVASCLSAILVASELSRGQATVTELLAGVVVCSTVAFRRRGPAAMAVLAGAGASLAGGSNPAQLVGSIAIVLDYYQVGRRSADRGWTWTDAALLTLPVLAIATDPSASKQGDPFVVDVISIWAFFLLVPFAAGRVVGGRVAVTAALRANNERLEEEQRARARQVVAHERARIARELHDVVAHSVSVMVIQTAAARRVASCDRVTATDALRSVERCGREALVDLRQMVGVLHRSDIGLLGAAAPGLAQLERLAERARASGLPVEINVRGDTRPLPAALDLISYRVVQEALTNAIKHAGPATARVRVDFGIDHLELEITDTGRGPSDGGGSREGRHGLRGMHERLAIFGGRLDTGPGPDGGFRIHATVPMGEASQP